MPRHTCVMSEQDVARQQAERIAADPRYQALVRRRLRFTWILTAIMLIAYFGYIALIAFDKAVLSAPIGGGVTSIGIPIGIGLILLGIVLTGIYVRSANRRFDPVVEELKRDYDAEAGR